MATKKTYTISVDQDIMAGFQKLCIDDKVMVSHAIEAFMEKKLIQAKR